MLRRTAGAAFRGGERVRATPHTGRAPIPPVPTTRKARMDRSKPTPVTVDSTGARATEVAYTVTSVSSDSFNP